MQDRVYRLACRVLADTALAEEATGQTFFKVWTGPPVAGPGQRRDLDLPDCRPFDPRCPSRPATLVETLEPAAEPADRRRPGRAGGSRRDIVGGGRSPGPCAREPQRGGPRLVDLYYFEQRGLAEIETILGVVRDTLKMRLSRARQRLRTILEKKDDA